MLQLQVFISVVCLATRSDKSLVIGMDDRASGFLWVAGQGGYGIQTSAAVSSFLCRAPLIL